MSELDTSDPANLEARIVTDLGDLIVGFRPDKAPGHVRNFLRLAHEGFYDGLAFHRVVRNFMVQGGCPNTRDGERGTPGTGGPSWRLPAEFNDLPHVRGTLSMARSADPNSAGSQFFLVHAESVPSLDGKYTVFGNLRAGHEVLDAIAAVDCAFGPGGERSKPQRRIGIQRVEIRVAELSADAGSDASANAAEGHA